MAKHKQKEFGIGIIGYSIGRVHAHGWQGVGEVFHPAKAKARLVALSGRTKERVQLEAQRYGFEKTYADWRRLVADDDVDIVDNCAPPYLHAEATIAAAQKGKDLICEKPMARNATEARQMLRAAEKAGVAHMVGYNYRFVPAVMLAKQIIDEGRLGRLYYCKGSYLNSYAHYESPETPFDWHHSSEMSGYGALGDLGTHAIDLTRFLVGEVKSVQSMSKNFINSRPEKKGSSEKVKVDVDDLTVSVLSLKNGAVGLLEASWMTPGRRDFLAFEAHGSKGSLMFNLERLNELEVYLPGEDPKLEGPRNVLVLGREHPFMTRYWANQAGGFSWENSFTNELNHYLECLVDKRSVSPQGASFLDGYKNCLIMDSMVESAKKGRRVEVEG